MMQRTANENAAVCKRRICKRSDQPKIDRIANNDARLILRKKLNGESARCNKLIEVFSWSTDIHILTKMVMTSDETQIQIFANWPLSHAKRVTRDNWKDPEYHVVAAIR